VSSHTLSVQLEDRPGALARVSQLIFTRGYNIDSLAVAATECPGISQLTLRLKCSEHALDQIERKINKLVNVLGVAELRAAELLERELALVTVTMNAAQRDLLPLTQAAGSPKVVDIGPDVVTFEVVGGPLEIAAFERLVRPFGIREFVRSGPIAAHRPSASVAAALPPTHPSERKDSDGRNHHHA
jgi:acetolactate synthase I/III small subunit